MFGSLISNEKYDQTQNKYAGVHTHISTKTGPSVKSEQEMYPPA